MDHFFHKVKEKQGKFYCLVSFRQIFGKFFQKEKYEIEYYTLQK